MSLSPGWPQMRGPHHSFELPAESSALRIPAIGIGLQTSEGKATQVLVSTSSNNVKEESCRL
jgi:hypothetical protein